MKTFDFTKNFKETFTDVGYVIRSENFQCKKCTAVMNGRHNVMQENSIRML